MEQPEQLRAAGVKGRHGAGAAEQRTHYVGTNGAARLKGSWYSKLLSPPTQEQFRGQCLQHLRGHPCLQ
ncbi:unnamed protein product [Closterium sp. Naga37s-1]|nr:unnamed protein product [Closterium sp. Naga37s-1]